VFVFFRFNGAILSVVGNVPVDRETSMMTSLISRFAGPIIISEVKCSHRDRVYMHAFRGEYALLYVSVCVCNRSFAKEKLFIRHLWIGRNQEYNRPIFRDWLKGVVGRYFILKCLFYKL
jgi:hypothetical protein